MAERGKAESTLLPAKQVAKELGEIATDFNMIKDMLNLPEKLHRSFGDTLTEYSAKEEGGIAALAQASRGGAKLPEWEKLHYSTGFFDSTSQTYFFLCDPSRKLFFVTPLLYNGSGSWMPAARELAKKIGRKE